MLRFPLVAAAAALLLAGCGPEVAVGDQYEEAATGQRFEIAQTSPDCDALVIMADQHYKVTQDQNRAGNAPVAEIQTDTGTGGPCVYYIVEPEGRRIYNVRSASELSSNRFRRLSP